MSAVKAQNATSAAAGSVRASYLGAECGGTRTVALFGPDKQGEFRRCEFGPGNLRLLDDAALVKHFNAIKRMTGQDFAGITIGMAGARTESDKARIRAAAARVWRGVPVYGTDDLETALCAAEEPNEPIARVLIISGTGSCCHGRSDAIRPLSPRRRKTGDPHPIRGLESLRLGGWGHILGDRGSGYAIGLEALRTVLGELDRAGKWPVLGQTILTALQLNEPNDLIDWVKGAEKKEVATLAETVFAAESRGIALARPILLEAADALAADGVNCARRLAGGKAPVEFLLAGSVLTRQPRFARWVAMRLRRLRPGSQVTVLRREGVWGALALAQKHFFGGSRRAVEKVSSSAEFPGPATLPPTEQRNPRSRNLDRLPLAGAVALMIREEGKVAAAIFKERRKIARAVAMIARSLRAGGRLFYVGAGTSGRLGILDASECPPTFRSPPGQVQGIIAGGRTAIWQSVEGAEDDAAGGAAAIEHRGVNTKDVVLGIAASGRTPFVWGALAAAKKRHARTILLCFNPRLEIPGRLRPDLVLAPETGPEILTGSTRLKAGTATKITLNILSTLAMVRLGKVMSNLMVDLNPSNIKLRERAVRIVQSLTGTPPAAARRALEKSRWRVKPACQLLQQMAGKRRRTLGKSKAQTQKKIETPHAGSYGRIDKFAPCGIDGL